MRFYDADGHYELNPFPGNNQLVVSNHVFIKPEKRGMGLGQVQHRQRLEQAKAMGYDFLICTVDATNKAEIAILIKNGWAMFKQFKNSVTGNQIQIWGRPVGDMTETGFEK